MMTLWREKAERTNEQIAFLINDIDLWIWGRIESMMRECEKELHFRIELKLFNLIMIYSQKSSLVEQFKRSTVIFDKLMNDFSWFLLINDYYHYHWLELMRIFTRTFYPQTTLTMGTRQCERMLLMFIHSTAIEYQAISNETKLLFDEFPYNPSAVCVCLFGIFSSFRCLM